MNTMISYQPSYLLKFVSNALHGTCLIVLLMMPRQALGAESSPPNVEAQNIRRAFYNGEHNAFTDLAYFQNHYYLTFRSCPDGHMVHPTSSIIILQSDDLQVWKKIHAFRVLNRDTRDPHFLVFKKKLFVFTGTWFSGSTTLPRDQYNLNKHLGYAAWTRDGMNWESPIMLDGTYGHHIWRASTHAGKAYLCGRRRHNFEETVPRDRKNVESLMLESDDGLIWKKCAVFQPTGGDETAFQFDRAGNVLAVSRSGSASAQLLRSSPPYEKWTRKELDRYIGGPLLTTWGERLVVGGRHSTPSGPRTTLYWLLGDTLREFITLPSAGDNSYPGFLQLSPSKAVLSWYSSHEKDETGQPITAIYLADLTVTRN